MSRGVYGTEPEINGIKYTYFFLFDQKNGASYVRLSDMDFGSAATHGLKWMTLLTCNSLYTNNVTSMANHSSLPDNENLHLMLGHSSTTLTTPWLGFLYASNLIYNVTIKNSLIAAETKAFADVYAKNPASMTNAVTVRVMGLQSCINDTLYLYNDPDPNTTYLIQDTPVFVP